MKIVHSFEDLERIRRQGEVSSALIEALRQDLALAAEIDPPDDAGEGLCGCRFVILEGPADAAASVARGPSPGVIEGVDEIFYAASLVASMRASASQIQAIAAQLERS